MIYLSLSTHALLKNYKISGKEWKDTIRRVQFSPRGVVVAELRLIRGQLSASYRHQTKSPVQLKPIYEQTSPNVVSISNKRDSN